MVKTLDQIEGISKVGKVIALCFDAIDQRIKPGMHAIEIEQIITSIAKYTKAVPVFKEINGYPYHSCVSINHETCHGSPLEDKVIHKGDFVTVDIGLRIGEHCADAAKTYLVESDSLADQGFFERAKCVFNQALSAVKPGQPFNVIGESLTFYANQEGIHVFPQFAGHGVGIDPHEPPKVLPFSNKESFIQMTLGHVFTIEPIFTRGAVDCEMKKDKWAYYSKDREASIQFEHTILVTANGYTILTPWKFPNNKYESLLSDIA